MRAHRRTLRSDAWTSADRNAALAREILLIDDAFFSAL
jgi:hypothetical protein